jgi:hypothetical protein
MNESSDDHTVRTSFSTDKKLIKRALKGSPHADSIAFCEDSEQAWLIMYKDKKPLAKIELEWIVHSLNTYFADTPEDSS